MIRGDFIEKAIATIFVTLDNLQYILLEHLTQLIIALAIFLLFIWFIHRIENRAAQDVIYRNFPFFEKAINSFQFKIDSLSVRIDALEERISRLENKIR